TDAPQGAYPCTGTDRWVVLSVDQDSSWAGLKRAMGSPSWADDKRFVTAAGRRRHHDELDEQLARWTASLDRWEVTRRCQAEGVIAGPVLDDADAAYDPQLRARGFFRPNGSDEVGWHDYPSHLWRWDGPEMRHEGLCPFGAASDDVWRQVVDLDGAALTALGANGHLLDHFVDTGGNPL
ncbi:MAG: CoA transferase, partial [Acidimicrobiia bacterium]|nr:CoA transferase [Acidimicrobiia bacterium]